VFDDITEGGDLGCDTGNVKCQPGWASSDWLRITSISEVEEAFRRLAVMKNRLRKFKLRDICGL
jgi:hypothetical protein